MGAPAEGDVHGRPINVQDGTPVGRTVVALGVFGVAVYALTAMYGFPRTGQFVPRVILYPLVLLSGVNLVREVLDLRRYLRSRPAVDADHQARARREVVAISWVVGYAALVFIIGFTWASLVFLLAFLRLYGQERWRLVGAVTAVMMALSYGFFHRWAGFRVYEGWLGPYLPL